MRLTVLVLVIGLIVIGALSATGALVFVECETGTESIFITGTVKAASTGAVLYLAKVEVYVGQNLYATRYTNPDGLYQFILSQGSSHGESVTYSVRASKEAAYLTQTKYVTMCPGDSQTVNFSLEDAPPPAPGGDPDPGTSTNTPPPTSNGVTPADEATIDLNLIIGVALILTAIFIAVVAGR